MGIMNRLFRAGPGSPEHRVVARDPDTGQHAPLPDDIEPSEWRYDGDPPSEQLFRLRHGNALDPGLTYVCAPVDGGYIDFEALEWVIEGTQGGAEPSPARETADRNKRRVERVERVLSDLVVGLYSDGVDLPADVLSRAEELRTELQRDEYGEDWDEVREHALWAAGRECEVCGVDDDSHRSAHGHGLHVHHIRPLDEFDSPAEANRPGNLAVVCKAHHDELERLPASEQRNILDAGGVER